MAHDGVVAVPPLKQSLPPVQVVPVGGSVLYGAEAGPAGDGGHGCQLGCPATMCGVEENQPQTHRVTRTL